MMRLCLFVLIVIIACMAGCTEAEDPNYGVSSVYAIEPSDGSMRWGYHFQGESVEIGGLRNGNNQVVIRLTDPCWDEDRLWAFNVQSGDPEDLVDPDDDTDSEETDLCELVTSDEVDTIYYVNEICIGTSSSSAGLLTIAFNAGTGEELWRTQYGFDYVAVVEDVFIGMESSVVEDGTVYIISNLSLTDGSVIWSYQNDLPMQLVDVDDAALFLFDVTPFAMKKEDGEIVWEASDFAVDAGVLLGSTLYMTKQQFVSPCAE